MFHPVWGLLEELVFVSPNNELSPKYSCLDLRLVKKRVCLMEAKEARGLQMLRARNY
jgi:hypothetical protein